MFLRMLVGALVRRGERHLLIAVTVALGAAVATSMLSVMFDVGDKVNQELKSYGANIVVRPRGAAVLQDLYGARSPEQTFLREDELGRIKTTLGGARHAHRDLVRSPPRPGDRGDARYRPRQTSGLVDGYRPVGRRRGPRGCDGR